MLAIKILSLFLKFRSGYREKCSFSKTMTSLFRCHSNIHVNKTYFFEKFIQSLVVVRSSLPNRPKIVKYYPVKVGMVCSWNIQSSHLNLKDSIRLLLLLLPTIIFHITVNLCIFVPNLYPVITTFRLGKILVYFFTRLETALLTREMHTYQMTYMLFCYFNSTKLHTSKFSNQKIFNHCWLWYRSIWIVLTFLCLSVVSMYTEPSIGP